MELSRRVMVVVVVVEVVVVVVVVVVELVVVVVVVLVVVVVELVAVVVVVVVVGHDYFYILRLFRGLLCLYLCEPHLSCHFRSLCPDLLACWVYSAHILAKPLFWLSCFAARR